MTAAAQADAHIRIAAVENGAATDEQTAQGKLVLPDNAVWRVGVLAEGRVEHVYANLGDAVSKGQILARYHSHEVHEVRASYANALAERTRLQAAQTLAQTQYERAQRLYALKADSVSDTEISRESLVNAQEATREADNTLAAERAHLEDLFDSTAAKAMAPGEEAELIPIKAPASGRIFQRNVSLGQTVSTSTDTFVIADMNRLWMMASVNTATLSKLYLGQSTLVTVPDLPGSSFSGKVTDLGLSVDPTTRLAQVRIKMAPTDARLRPEMLATARFSTRQGVPSILVPQEALQQVNGEDVVFVVVAPTRFRVQTVDVGAVLGTKVQITRGLSATEQVITQGSFIAKSQLLKSSIGD